MHSMPPAARVLGSSQTRPLMFQRPQGPLTRLAAAGHKGHTDHFHGEAAAAVNSNRFVPTGHGDASCLCPQRQSVFAALSACAQCTLQPPNHQGAPNWHARPPAVSDSGQQGTHPSLRRFTTHACLKNEKRRAVATACLPLPWECFCQHPQTKPRSVLSPHQSYVSMRIPSAQRNSADGCQPRRATAQLAPARRRLPSCGQLHTMLAPQAGA